MAWGEWEQAKADTAARMQLNQVDPGSGQAGGPALASSSAKQRAAANAIDPLLVDATVKAGNVAGGKTNAAVKEFSAKDGHGWDTSAALKKAHGTWEKQVKGLLGLLHKDRDALLGTRRILGDTDIQIGTQLRRSSPLPSTSQERPPSAFDRW
ncbi:hypothetical protein [Streptomyces sp. NPDC058869]|uniref:hypothetical protein n=1 Tax=Streptomyces sp. NPDC058869 TaxID=3346659 RepID=UPI0036BF3A6B